MRRRTPGPPDATSIRTMLSVRTRFGCGVHCLFLRFQVKVKRVAGIDCLQFQSKATVSDGYMYSAVNKLSGFQNHLRQHKLDNES